MEANNYYTKIQDAIENDLDKNVRLQLLSEIFCEIMLVQSEKSNLKEARNQTIKKFPELSIVIGYFMALHRLQTEGYSKDVSCKTLDTLCIVKLICEHLEKSSGSEVPYELQMYYSTLAPKYNLRLSKDRIDAKLATVILENYHTRIKRGTKALIALSAINLVFLISYMFL